MNSEYQTPPIQTLINLCSVYNILHTLALFSIYKNVTSCTFLSTIRSNLTNIAPPGQLLIGVESFRETPKWEKIALKFNPFELCEIAWVQWQPIMRF